MLVEVCQSLRILPLVFVIIFSSTAVGVYKLLTMLLVKLPGPVVPYWFVPILKCTLF